MSQTVKIDPNLAVPSEILYKKVEATKTQMSDM